MKLQKRQKDPCVVVALSSKISNLTLGLRLLVANQLSESWFKRVGLRGRDVTKRQHACSLSINTSNGKVKWQWNGKEQEICGIRCEKVVVITWQQELNCGKISEKHCGASWM